MSTVSLSTGLPAGTWTVDPIHSNVGFAAKHMGIATVRGAFTEFEGTIEIGEDLSTAKAYGTVNVESIDTNDPQRDSHLRSPDFLDAATTRSCTLSPRGWWRWTTRPFGSPAT